MDQTLRLARIVARANVFRVPDAMVSALASYLDGRGDVDALIGSFREGVDDAPLAASIYCLGDEFDPVHTEFDAVERRVLELVAAHPARCLTTFMTCLRGDVVWDRVLPFLCEHGIERRVLLEHCMVRSTEWGWEAPTGLGRFVLAEVPAQFEVMRAFARAPRVTLASLERVSLQAEARQVLWALFRLLLSATPPDVDRAEILARDVAVVEQPAWLRELLLRAPERALPWALERVESPEGQLFSSLLAPLAALDPEAARRFARRLLDDAGTRARCATSDYALAIKLVAAREPSVALPPLEDWALAQGLPEALDLLESLAPERAEGVLLAHATSLSPVRVSEALKRLFVRDSPRHDELAMWAVTHEAKIVRDAARAYLERRGEATVLSLEALLEHAPLDARVTLVELLGTAGGARGKQRLRAHLDTERSGKVRKVMLSLVGDSDAAPQDDGRASLAAAAEEMKRLIPRPAVGWFDPGAAPALRWSDGSEAPSAMGGYLLHCQSSVKGLELDPRVGPVVHALEPEAMGLWAQAMLAAWEKHDSESRYAWCVVLAAAMNPSVTTMFLIDAVERWAVKRRAMAVMGVQVLAMMGGDEAVQALTEIRDAHPGTVGAVASSALEAEAGERGLSRDELEDAVVPRFWFDEQRVWWASYGPRRFRVELADDFLLNVSDERARTIASLPKPGARDDATLAARSYLRWKVLRARLIPSVERELARMERALVEGRVWRASRWLADVVRHPVLGVLASPLVWQRSDGRTLRARDGQTLDADDAPCAVADDDTIRLAHPVALDAEALRRWRAAFTRGLVRPPFAQLDREVFRVDDLDREALALESLRGRVVRAGPSTRKGIQPVWETYGFAPLPTVGHLCPGFRRRFAGDGLVAEIAVHGIALWRETWVETEVHALRFLTTDADARAVPLGAVPARVYSEAVRAATLMTGAVV